MNSVAVANQEEAATIAAEFLSSLDNLPNEVQHLLAEIKHKDTRVNELQQEIHKNSDRYFRHALKNLNIKEPKENGKDKDTKDSAIQARVSNAFAEMEQLSKEKIALATRLVETLTRVSARLDHDHARVVQLSGEQTQEQYEVRGGYVVGTLPGASAPIGLSANTSISAPVPRSVRELQDSLRSAVANELVSATPPPPGAAQNAQKRKLHDSHCRRLNTGAAVASISANVSRAHTPQARSRLSQQVHPSPPPPPAASRSRRIATPAVDEDDEGEDADADGDVDDQDESGDPEDKGLYCYCQKVSYGEMIACDNDSCPYEWFHLGCVGLKQPLPDSWFCDECLKSLGAGGGGSRKGRRKAQ
ncbi:uncharacterized protein FOMMEDRAFT_83591 [Fomitiporia mediterranea MF3/22]|uniref:uncharacterized protein n=1 Tax=Fomitiporia mediterranea (strain MF3/22) TaxID=694068 RepID=UPI0004408985|nr:uncharacterized protein FOMMEDRAFT_83591 [Fomitiporia mediterranea MF3/22]EJD03861.1 hypothetical protein FOMMEDRAFT_83591 [Fomitiporia mediterranea MF3/22]